MSRRAGVAVAATGVGLIGVGAIAAAAGRLRDWGSTEAERRRTWPGDELVADPGGSTVMAVDVDAPAEAVWRWLVQIGQDRGGWYSYDRLENLFGLRIHTTDEIREEWQHLAPGDLVRMIPRNWLHLVRDGFGLPVARVEPPHLLVLREDPADTPWDAVWTFAVEPAGEGRSRLISHGRDHRGAGAGATVARVLGVPMQLVTSVMTRRMLLGIKERAERAGRVPA